MNYYRERLSSCDTVKIVSPEPESKSAIAQFTIAIEFKEKLAELLKEKHIPFAIHYPLPIHHQPAYRFSECKFINSEKVSLASFKLARTCLLSDDQLEYITTAILEYHAQFK